MLARPFFCLFDGVSFMADLDKIRKAIDLRVLIPLEGKTPHKGYLSGYCPFHESPETSQTASFLLWPDHFKCLSVNCGISGDIFNWYAHKLGIGATTPLKGSLFGQVVKQIESDYPALKSDSPNSEPLPGRYKLSKTEEVKAEKPKLDLQQLAETYHDYLMRTPQRINYFLSRGFTLRTIKEQLWGWDGQNYVITVWRGRPQHSRLMTLRLRVSADKQEDNQSRYSGVRGYNDQMLYNRHALLWCLKHRVTTLLVFYGELDAQLAWQDGLPAVSPTNGALAVMPEWFTHYKGDLIFVPDKKEESAAWSDAGEFGSRGWVGHLPDGEFKDYGELYAAAGTCAASQLQRYIEKQTGLKIVRRRKSLARSRSKEY